MKKEKLKITSLKIESFVTQLGVLEKKTIDGGVENGSGYPGCDSIGAGKTCAINSRCCPSEGIICSALFVCGAKD